MNLSGQSARRVWKSLLIALLVLGSVLAVWRLKEEHESLLDPRINLSAALVAEYQSVVSSPAAAASAKTHALIELARAGDLMAREWALKFAKSPEVGLRIAAGAALGYFPGKDVFLVLERLVSDEAPEVRARTIGSLCQIRGSRRDALLARLSRDSQRVPSERVVALGCGLRLTQNFEPLTQVVDASLAGGNPEARLAFSQLVALAGGSGQTTELALKIVQKASDPVLLTNAVRYLAGRPRKEQGAELGARMTSLLQHSDPRVRLASAESIHLVCPPDRWNLLGELMKHEVDGSVREAAIQSASFLDRGNGQKFFAGLRSTGPRTEAEVAALAAAEKRLGLAERIDSCQ